jgi:hypothetical protein
MDKYFMIKLINTNLLLHGLPIVFISYDVLGYSASTYAHRTIFLKLCAIK